MESGSVGFVFHLLSSRYCFGELFHNAYERAYLTAEV